MKIYFVSLVASVAISTTCALPVLQGESDSSAATLDDERDLRGGPKWQTCKISAGTKVGIYVGGGIGSSSKLWAEAFVAFWQTGNRSPVDGTKLNAGRRTFTGDSEITYVTLTDNEFER